MVDTEAGRQRVANVWLTVCESAADRTRQMTVVIQQTYVSTVVFANLQLIIRKISLVRTSKPRVQQLVLMLLKT